MTSSVYKTIFFSLIILSACGHEEADKRPLGGNASTGRREEQASTTDQFKTRLNNRLMVAGAKCEGGETTRINDRVERCERGQYLIIFDDINTCGSDGLCTDIGVHPIISDLTLVKNTPVADYYQIGPVSVVSSSRERRIKGVVVMVIPDGSATVLSR